MAIVHSSGMHVGVLLNCCMCNCLFEIESGDKPVDTQLMKGPKVGFWFQCPECPNAVAARIMDCTCNVPEESV
jgi:hypothetical protein